MTPSHPPIRIQASTRPASVLLLAAVAMFAAGATSAPVHGQNNQVYKWTDAEGNVHYSDRLPSAPDARNRQLLNRAGIRIRDLDIVRDADAAASQAELVASSRRDWALASAYENESELRRAQEERLSFLRNSIAMAQTNIDKLALALAAQEAHAAEIGQGRPVPMESQERIEATRGMLAEQREELVKLQLRYGEALDQQDDEMRRYRELTAPEANGEQPDP